MVLTSRHAIMSANILRIRGDEHFKLLVFDVWADKRLHTAMLSAAQIKAGLIETRKVHMRYVRMCFLASSDVCLMYDHTRLHIAMLNTARMTAGLIETRKRHMRYI